MGFIIKLFYKQLTVQTHTLSVFAVLHLIFKGDFPTEICVLKVQKLLQKSDPS